MAKKKVKNRTSVPSATTKHCGLCNKTLSVADLKLQLTKNCVACGSECVIKPICGQRLLSKITGTKTTKKKAVDKKVFERTDVQLYCYKCKEICFYCRKPHQITRKSHHCIISIY